MAERIAQLTAEISADVSGLTSGLGAAQGKLQGFKGGITDAVEGLTGMNIGALAAGGAVGLLAGGIKDAIDTTLNWADGMDKLARNTGGTIADVSKLAIVTGDFGISAGTLEMALKSLNSNGLTLNLDTLGDLAQQYQALPPGVDRLTFATKYFGRSAQEMTEILSQTPGKLAAMGLAAEKSGKIMSEVAVEAAQELKLELAQLGDQVDGLKISAGPSLISVLSGAIHGLDAAATAANQLDKMWQLNAVDVSLYRGELSEEAAVAIKEQIVQGKTNYVLAAGNETRFAAIAALEQQTSQMHALTGAYDSQIGVAEGLAAAQAGLNLEDRLGASLMGNLTAEMVLNTAAAGENSLAQLEIARGLGLVDENTLSAIGKVQTLKEGYDAGAISLANYVYQLRLIRDGLDGLNDKVVNVSLHYQSYGAEGAAGVLAVGPDIVVDDKRAAGGPVMAGHPYLVGERGPEVIVPSQNGMVIPNGKAGGITQNFNFYNTAPTTPATAMQTARAVSGAW